MQTFSKPLTSLTADDVMSRTVMTIPSYMSLRLAACMLAKAEISGAPVVDETGRCVGVLSAIDFLRAAQTERLEPKHTTESCVCTPWQMVEMERLPTDEVGTLMSGDPVTASPSTTIVELAKMMTDAHIHRVIVVDGKRRPIGIVSSTDIIAAVAREE